MASEEKETIAATFRWELGYTLNKYPAHCRAKQAFTYKFNFRTIHWTTSWMDRPCGHREDQVSPYHRGIRTRDLSGVRQHFIINNDVSRDVKACLWPHHFILSGSWGCCRVHPSVVHHGALYEHFWVCSLAQGYLSSALKVFLHFPPCFFCTRACSKNRPLLGPILNWLHYHRPRAITQHSYCCVVTPASDADYVCEGRSTMIPHLFFTRILQFHMCVLMKACWTLDQPKA